VNRVVLVLVFGCYLTATVPVDAVAAGGPSPVGVYPSPVVDAASGDFSLANGGERLRLRRGNDTVDVVRYEDAPEAEVYRVEGPDGERE